jgi:hypothetical protein
MRPRAVVAVVSTIPVVVGGYMLFDGMHALLLGRYFGPGIGPWGFLVSLVGVDPASMAALFVVLGSLWLFFLVSGFYRRGWAWYGRVVIAVATLWYLPLGTVLSLVQLAVLVRYRNLLRSST